MTPTTSERDRARAPRRGRGPAALRARIAAWLDASDGLGGLVGAAPPVPVPVVARRFWPYARPYRLRLLAGVLLACVVPVLEVAQIWLFKLVIDEVLVPQDLGPLLWIALAFAALALVEAVVRFGEDYLGAWVGERFLLDVRTDVFGHLQALPLAALDRRRLGDLLQRLGADVAAIERFLLAGLTEAIAAVTAVVVVCGALLLLDWRLALVALVVGPLFALVARSFARLARRAAREKVRRSGSLAAHAEEVLGNAALVRTSRRVDDETARLRREGERIAAAELAATRIGGVFAPIVDLIESAGALIVIAVGTVLLTSGDLTLGGLLVFLAYLTRLFSPVRALGDLATTAFAAAAGAERVLEVLEEQPGVRDRPEARALGAVEGRLAVEGVAYRHAGRDRDALRDVTFHVEPGRVLAVVGPSGAGKSTLAQLLVRLDDPDAGCVRLDGADLRDLRLDDVRRAVGLLLQDGPLLDASVRDNIAYARPAATDAEVEHAARLAGAHRFVAALPDGYATRVGQRGRALSGGQRRRVALARAYLADAPVLVLDEPTAGLDADTRDSLLPDLLALLRGRTAVVITHDPVLATAADDVVELRDGRVVSAGAHA